MKEIKYYILIIIISVIAAGLLYLTILFDYFYISAFDTAAECPSVYTGENAIEELNARLLYTSLGNTALILLIFVAFNFSLKLITSKNRRVALLVCVIASMPLINTIYDGWALGAQTIKRCEYSRYFPIPDSDENAPLALPPDFKLNDLNN